MPKVRISGCSLSRLTRKPLTRPMAAPSSSIEATTAKRQRRVGAKHEAGQHHHQARDHADAEVDHAGGDHEGLADGEDAEHARLAQDVGRGWPDRGRQVWRRPRQGSQPAAGARCPSTVQHPVATVLPSYSHVSAVFCIHDPSELHREVLQRRRMQIGREGGDRVRDDGRAVAMVEGFASCLLDADLGDSAGD